MSSFEILFYQAVLFPIILNGDNLGEDTAEAFLLMIDDLISEVIMPLYIVDPILDWSPLGIPEGIVNVWPVIYEFNLAF